MVRCPPSSTLFPYTTLFRSLSASPSGSAIDVSWQYNGPPAQFEVAVSQGGSQLQRSEEHTSELQSRFDLVCRLLLEKKKEKRQTRNLRTSDNNYYANGSYRY